MQSLVEDYLLFLYKTLNKVSIKIVCLIHPQFGATLGRVKIENTKYICKVHRKFNKMSRKKVY